MASGNTQSHDGRAVLTVEEAGHVLGIGRNLAYDLARRGEIPTLRLGRRLVVPRAQLDALLTGSREETGAGSAA